MQRFVRTEHMGRMYTLAVEHWTAFLIRTGAGAPAIDEKIAFGSGFDYGAASMWPTLRGAMSTCFVLGSLFGSLLIVLLRVLF